MPIKSASERRKEREQQTSLSKEKKIKSASERREEQQLTTGAKGLTGAAIGGTAGYAFGSGLAKGSEALGELAVESFLENSPIFRARDREQATIMSDKLPMPTRDEITKQVIKDRMAMTKLASSKKADKEKFLKIAQDAQKEVANLKKQLGTLSKEEITDIIENKIFKNSGEPSAFDEELKQELLDLFTGKNDSELVKKQEGIIDISNKKLEIEKEKYLNDLKIKENRLEKALMSSVNREESLAIQKAIAETKKEQLKLLNEFGLNKAVQNIENRKLESDLAKEKADIIKVDKNYVENKYPQPREEKPAQDIRKLEAAEKSYIQSGAKKDQLNKNTEMYEGDRLALKENQIGIADDRIDLIDRRVEENKKQLDILLNQEEKLGITRKERELLIQEKINEIENLSNDREYLFAKKRHEYFQQNPDRDIVDILGKKSEVYEDVTKTQMEAKTPKYNRAKAEAIGRLAQQGIDIKASPELAKETYETGKKAQLATDVFDVVQEANTPPSGLKPKAFSELAKTTGMALTSPTLQKALKYGGASLGAIGGAMALADAAEEEKNLEEQLKKEGVPDELIRPIAIQATKGKLATDMALTIGQSTLLPSNIDEKNITKENIEELGPTYHEQQQMAEKENLERLGLKNQEDELMLTKPQYEDGGTAQEPSVLDQYTQLKAQQDPFQRVMGKDEQLAKAQEDFIKAQTPALKRTSDMGKEFIKSQEGFSSKPKWDYKQHSYGYGTKYEPGMPTELTEEQASELFAKKLGTYEQMANQLIGDKPVPQETYDAIVSYLYNTGTGALRKKSGEESEFSKYAKSGDWNNAINEMDIVTAGGKRLPGLEKRRRMERDLARQGLFSQLRNKVVVK